MKKCFYPNAVHDAEWAIVKGNGSWSCPDYQYLRSENYNIILVLKVPIVDTRKWHVIKKGYFSDKQRGKDHRDNCHQF